MAGDFAIYLFKLYFCRFSRFCENSVNCFLNMSITEKTNFKKGLGKQARKQFTEFSQNLENLHKYNLHKYMAKSPAIHLDLFDASVRGGIDNYYEITQRFLNF